MFCSSDSARNLLKTCVIPIGDFQYSTGDCSFAESFVRGRAKRTLLSRTLPAPFAERILPFARDLLLFSDFVLRLNRSSRKMAKLENLPVCRDEHTTRCLDQRF